MDNFSTAPCDFLAAEYTAAPQYESAACEYPADHEYVAATPSFQQDLAWADLDKILSEKVFDEVMLRELGFQPKSSVLNLVVLPIPVRM